MNAGKVYLTRKSISQAKIKEGVDHSLPLKKKNIKDKLLRDLVVYSTS